MITPKSSTSKSKDNMTSCSQRQKQELFICPQKQQHKPFQQKYTESKSTLSKEVHSKTDIVAKYRKKATTTKATRDTNKN